MPRRTAEALRARTAKLKKKIADKGDALTGEALRREKKKVRRVQRARRKVDAETTRRAGKPAATEA